MPIEVTLFIPPIGEQHVIQVTDVTDEDAAWFTENKIIISMEKLSSGAKVVYGRFGVNEHQECLVVGMNKTCKSMLKELRSIVQTEISNGF